MTLGEFAAARSAYERAIALARAQDASTGAAPVDSVVLDAEERLVEAIKELRRERVTRAAEISLAIIGIALLALRPWRGADGPILRAGARLALATLALAVLAVGGAYVVRTFIDPSSPIESSAAGLLVVRRASRVRSSRSAWSAVCARLAGARRGDAVAARRGDRGVAAARPARRATLRLFPVLDSMSSEISLADGGDE